MGSLAVTALDASSGTQRPPRVLQTAGAVAGMAAAVSLWPSLRPRSLTDQVAVTALSALVGLGAGAAAEAAVQRIDGIAGTDPLVTRAALAAGGIGAGMLLGKIASRIHRVPVGLIATAAMVLGIGAATSAGLMIERRLADRIAGPDGVDRWAVHATAAALTGAALYLAFKPRIAGVAASAAGVTGAGSLKPWSPGVASRTTIERASQGSGDELIAVIGDGGRVRLPAP